MAKDKKFYGLIDPPPRYGNILEMWERHLAWLKTLPADDALKSMSIAQANEVIARKRAEKTEKKAPPASNSPAETAATD